MLETITNFLTPERTRITLSVLAVMFYIAAICLAVFVTLRSSRMSGKRKRILFLFPAFFIAAICTILIYQATWQLAGFTRKNFVRFMERHNPRSDNVAGKLVRGSIIDSIGNILAETDPAAKGLRYYPYGEATAHVVGFRHPEEGLTGLENAADILLSGYADDDENAFKKVSSAAIQSTRYTRHVGTNLVLTLDAELQLYAHSLMEGRKGAIVAIDPRDGAIRILLSSPAFDPNKFDRLLNIDPQSPLLNRALHGRYPPGSTFKMAIAGLAVECGIGLNIMCPAGGYYAPGSRRPIRDHEYYSFEKRGQKWHGFGVLDLNTAFAKSSNTYFANAGVQCGITSFNAMAERLRFNSRIPVYQGINGVVSSQVGNIPKLGGGERRELSQLSIGQGRLTTTPLHMAMMVAAIANNGQMFKPRIAESDPVVDYGMLFSRSASLRVKQAMRHAIKTGTGRKADIPGLDVCGKTGTAQNPGGEDHSWFVCFAPHENPTIAIAVIIENAGYGSASALPVAVSLLRENAANEAYRAQQEDKQ